MSKNAGAQCVIRLKEKMIKNIEGRIADHEANIASLESEVTKAKREIKKLKKAITSDTALGDKLTDDLKKLGDDSPDMIAFKAALQNQKRDCGIRIGENWEKVSHCTTVIRRSVLAKTRLEGMLKNANSELEITKTVGIQDVESA